MTGPAVTAPGAPGLTMLGSDEAPTCNDEACQPSLTRSLWGSPQ
jgi:hypothetical protein